MVHEFNKFRKARYTLGNLDAFKMFVEQTDLTDNPYLFGNHYLSGPKCEQSFTHANDVYFDKPREV